MKLTEQSELKMETECRPVARRYRRISQANWWFAQMRRAANGACPTEPDGERRSVQRRLPLLG